MENEIREKTLRERIISAIKGGALGTFIGGLAGGAAGIAAGSALSSVAPGTENAEELIEGGKEVLDNAIDTAKENAGRFLDPQSNRIVGVLLDVADTVVDGIKPVEVSEALKPAIEGKLKTAAIVTAASGLATTGGVFGAGMGYADKIKVERKQQALNKAEQDYNPSV